MHPVLFGAVRAYPVFLGLAVMVGAGVAFHSAQKAGLRFGYFLPRLAILAGPQRPAVADAMERLPHGQLAASGAASL